MSTQNTAPAMANMNEVVMRKDDLLQHLIENKAKHDVVLASAIEGYWDTAKEKIVRRRKKFDALMREYKKGAHRAFDDITKKIVKKEELPQFLDFRQPSVDSTLGLTYPQDHTADYDMAIKMMQSSVFDQVRLTTQEYSSYVLNNWKWKEEFLASNRGYVENTRAKQAVSNCFIGTNGFAGPAGPSGVKGLAGDYGDRYSAALQNSINTVQLSGLANF